MLNRRQIMLGSAALAGAASLKMPFIARAADPIKIGEINSYSGLPAFTLPYRNGWQLALEQVNEAGGVLGRPLEIVSRDDAGRPGDAVTMANELVTRERVDILAGGFFSHIGLALSDFARQRRIFFLATEPLTDDLIWARGNRYTFRLRPSTYMQSAMLVAEAAKLPATRWATVAPNYEYGQSAVAAFKRLLSEQRPDIEWVAEQWPAQGRIEAGPTVQALARSQPEAIFNVTFGADLSAFVREGSTRGLFDGREVASLLTGEPEYMDPLRDEAPEGWIVTGYPWYDIDTPEHTAFLEAYRARFDDYPRLGSVVGYSFVKSVAAALAKAGGTETDALIESMRGLGHDSPFGPITYRPEDHQSTMGAYVGRTAVRDGRGIMVDWYYADGADYLPSPEEVAELRPAE